MKALQILNDNKLGLISKDSDALAPWEARVSVAISLVCGSDLKNIRLSSSVSRVPGHEFSGVVTEVSKEAIGILKIGERISAFPMMPCHSCVNCKNRIFRDCEFKESLGGVDWPGSFATELIIDARMAVVLPQELTMEQGALLEHLCCAYRFAKEILESGSGIESHILIIGDGPIALGNLQMLLLEGYKNVTLLGKYSLRLKLAKELGAREVFEISALNESSHADLETVDICVLSAPSEKMILNLSKVFKYGASIIEQTRFLDAELKQLLISRGFIFRRAFAYHLSDFDQVTQLIIAGLVKTDQLVTSRISLEDFGPAYPDVLAKHRNIKVAVISDQVLFESRNKG